jgi:hypothetical protein
MELLLIKVYLGIYVNNTTSYVILDFLIPYFEWFEYAIALNHFAIERLVPWITVTKEKQTKLERITVTFSFISCIFKKKLNSRINTPRNCRN